jgi:hypothetical protein
MPLDFPNSPSLNATFTAENGRVWVWDGSRWESVGSLGDVLDFAVTNPVQDQTLAYDETLEKWINSVATGGGGSGSISVAETAPGSPGNGDLWFNSSNATTYIYYDGFWVELSEGRNGIDAIPDGDQTIIAGQVFG